VIDSPLRSEQSSETEGILFVHWGLQFTKTKPDEAIGLQKPEKSLLLKPYPAMALPLIPLIACILLFGLAVYQFIIHPTFLSPLSEIPNAHWSAPISRLWILLHRGQHKQTPLIHSAHEKLGPIIRLAPNEVSVNSVDGGIRTIYSGGWEKGDWYLNVFNNYGVMPMFSMPTHALHSRRKRMLSNIYAKGTLQASAAMTANTLTLLHDRIVPRLRAMAADKKPAEFYDLFSAAAMDFVVAYIFGLKNGTNFVREPTMGKKFFRDYKARQRYAFFPQEMPKFTKLMSKIGLRHVCVPQWVDQANADIEDWLLGMCDKAESTLRTVEREGEKGRVEDWPTVYAQLRNALLKDSAKALPDAKSEDESVAALRLQIASELLDHTLAGFDTSSITLTWLAWELSKPQNLKWQEQLHTELNTLNGSRDAKELDSLPVLHAIIQETLRLHAAIPGNQPRITPSSPSTLGANGHEVSGLPPNVRVQAQAWSLHREASVFPEPETWRPSRWLERRNGGDSTPEHMREMQRWFWAFGSGGRMCVGSNLAMLDMKAIVAGIWADFRTTIADDSGMKPNGGYEAEPVGRDGRFLLLNVEEVGGQ
jgi:cytochrome P450